MLIDFSKLENTGIKKPSYKKKKSAKNVAGLNDSSMTSKDIVKALRIRFVNHKYLINNAYIFEWESDFFSVSESGYIYEVEIKITRGDYKDDFNKTSKHNLLNESSDSKFNLKRPNKFFYAAPKGLLNTIEIPTYAGLIEVDFSNNTANVTKEAPFLHRDNGLNNLKDILLDKFYNRYIDLVLDKELNESKK